jgi:hypothetical protein
VNRAIGWQVFGRLSFGEVLKLFCRRGSRTLCWAFVTSLRKDLKPRVVWKLIELFFGLDLGILNVL